MRQYYRKLIHKKFGGFNPLNQMHTIGKILCVKIILQNSFDSPLIQTGPKVMNNAKF
jgi:hypothetical protein